MPAVDSAREQVLQAVRAWAVHCTGLASTKVIVGGDAAPRPALPYLAVTVLLPSVPVGSGELLHSVVTAGTPPVTTPYDRVLGQRRATVQVDAYGRTASDLLERLALCIELPTAQAVLEPYGVGVARVLGARNGMMLRDTAYEERGVLDLEVTYAIETIPAVAAAADHLGYTVTIDRTSNPPADLVVTGTVDL